MATQIGDRKLRKTTLLPKAILAALAALLVGTAVAFLVVPAGSARAWSQFLGAIGW
jgi:hypothetical protein